MPNPIVAIAGSAIAGAGTSLIGASRSATAAQNASDAQVQAARDTNATNLQIYQDQTGRQEPFRQLGVSAINPLADLLGLDYQTGGAAQQAMPQNGGANYFGGGFNAQAYMQANPDVARSFYPGAEGFNTADEFARAHWQTYGQREGRNTGIPQNRIDAPQNTTAQATTGQDRTRTALDALTERPGYQFRLGQGNDAYEASAASRGMTMSGAQQRALAEYNQNFASHEYDNEINRLLAVMGGGQVATNNQNANAGAFGAMNAQSNANAANAQASGYMNSANAWNQGVSGAANAITGGIGAYGGTQGWFSPQGATTQSTPRNNNSYYI